MFKIIVVGVDGSDHSRNALRAACELATRFDSEMHLVHAPELSLVEMSPAVGEFTVPPTDEELQTAGKRVMDEAETLARNSGVTPASMTIGRGAASDEIMAIAHLHSADLIVTGRSGLGALGSLFLGSTSQKIAHDAKCACLTVL